MVETAIGIVGGAIVAIIVTVVVEVLRRPKLRMTIVPGERVPQYPLNSTARTGHYLHIDLVNEPLPGLFRWLARDAALQCRGTITFHNLDGGQFFAAPMPVRFARSPEPIPLQIRFSGGAGVLVDPQRMSLESRFDLYPGEATPFDVAVKFDSDDAAYGWTNQNYFSEPIWRNPDWKIPQGRYLVKVTMKSSNATCRGLFRLLNDAGPNDFRLEPAQTTDRVSGH
jgi:hypothetical protein